MAAAYFTLDDEPRAAVWDEIFSPVENKTYYLNGPPTSSVCLEEYKDRILPLVSETVLEKGRMDTSTYRTWIPGPFCGERRGRHTVGVFVKIYNGEDAWRGIREYETMGYLGQQRQTLPNVVTVRNYPSPTMLFGGRLLILPLILSTKNLKSFCQKKRDFYQKNFGVVPDLSMVLGGEAGKNSRRDNEYLGVSSCGAKFCRLFENFLLDDSLQRELLRETGFVHGDSLSCNVLKENARSLHHRLTGEWPPPGGDAATAVAWRFRGKEDGTRVLVRPQEVSVFVDYDTVSFPSDVEYPMTVEEQFTETPGVLKTFYCYDRVHDYVCLLKERVVPLARKVAVREIAGGRFRKCCEAACEKTERFFTPPPQDDLLLRSSMPEKTFHDLHSSLDGIHDDENERDYAYYMTAIVNRMKQLVGFFQRVMDGSFEDEYTISKELRWLLMEDLTDAEDEENVVVIN